MPRFTDDELHRLTEGHPATDGGLSALIRQNREKRTLSRFAQTPAHDDATGQRALLPHYQDLPGLNRWPRPAHVWRSRSLATRAAGSEAWHVSLQADPSSTDVEDYPVRGPFTTWAEAMDVARAEARYVVERPARPAPATPDRVAELRATAFADPADVQEVCS